MICCNRNLNAFQRRSMRLFGVCLLSLVVVTYSARYVFDRVRTGHLSPSTGYGMAVLSIIPMMAALLVIARYLSGETDEFVRAVVVRSMLWGFAAIMVGDTVLGFALQMSTQTRFVLILGIFNMDIFFVATGIALRIQLWRNR